MTRYALTATLLCLGISTSNAQDPFPQFEKRTHKEGEKTLPYRLLVPKGYKPGTALPLIVWLHGSGEKGTDNVSPLRALDKTILADADKCPAFVLVPQCPPKTAWHAVGLNKTPEVTEPARMLVAMVAELQKEFGLDGRRIYVGGFSMGGCGAWELLTRYPDLFAAAFPIAGPPFAGKPGERPGLAAVVKHVPIWTFHGDRDNTAPVDGTRAIVATLKKEGADVTYTEYKGGGHECASTLKDPKLMDWLLAQKRKVDPSFVQAKVPESATLIVKTLPDGGEQVVAGEVVVDLFLRVAVVDDPTDQPQHVLVLDLAGDQTLRDLVVQRREELLDVGLQDVAVAAGELLAAAHGGVRAFARATGVGIRDERLLVDRLQHVHEGVVNDAIPVRGRADLPLLGFVDVEAAVRSRLVGLRGEFFVQFPQRPFLIEVERGHGGAEPFALAGLLGGTK